MQFSYTAAQAASGVDLMGLGLASAHKYGQKARILKTIGLVGSTAIADFNIDLYAGQRHLGTFYNTTAGAAKVPIDVDRKEIQAFIPANSPLIARCGAAANAQNVVLELEFGTPTYRPASTGYTAQRAAVGGYRKPWVPKAQWLAEKRAGLR